LLRNAVLSAHTSQNTRRDMIELPDPFYSLLTLCDKEWNREFKLVWYLVDIMMCCNLNLPEFFLITIPVITTSTFGTQEIWFA